MKIMSYTLCVLVSLGSLLNAQQQDETKAFSKSVKKPETYADSKVITDIKFYEKLISGIDWKKQRTWKEGLSVGYSTELEALVKVNSPMVKDYKQYFLDAPDLPYNEINAWHEGYLGRGLQGNIIAPVAEFNPVEFKFFIELLDDNSISMSKKRTIVWEFGDQAKDLNKQIEENLVIFNESLKRISVALYGQQYVLAKATVDSKGKNLRYLSFEMPGVNSNPGTGEKKGHITAFDLAYIEFAEKINISHLNFIMHDQIENVDGRQIVKILEELVPSINCQYIAPILKDKIPDEIDIMKYSIIELSQDKKLFKF